MVTINRGEFVASDGWRSLFEAMDVILANHEATVTHRVHFASKSEGGIDVTAACCDELWDQLERIARRATSTCQACGQPGVWSAYLVECAEHRGQWPYNDPTTLPRLGQI